MSAIQNQSRVLVVDDSVIMRNMIRNILSEYGYTNVEDAEGGPAALEKIQASKDRKDGFRVIILDIAMPGMDGLTFLEVCRADPAMSDVAIIMVTAISEQHKMIEAITKGATAYVTKPFAPEKIFEAMKYVSAWAEKLERKS